MWDLVHFTVWKWALKTGLFSMKFKTNFNVNHKFHPIWMSFCILSHFLQKNCKNGANLTFLHYLRKKSINRFEWPCICVRLGLIQLLYDTTSLFTQLWVWRPCGQGWKCLYLKKCPNLCDVHVSLYFCWTWKLNAKLSNTVVGNLLRHDAHGMFVAGGGELADWNPLVSHSIVLQHFCQAVASIIASCSEGNEDEMNASYQNETKVKV